MMSGIELTEIHGRKSLSGIDSNGNTWHQFELDYYTSPYRCRCFMCGNQIEIGWENKQGQHVCDAEITYEGIRSYYFSDEVVKGIDYNPSELNEDWWGNIK